LCTLYLYSKFSVSRFLFTHYLSVDAKRSKFPTIRVLHVHALLCYSVRILIGHFVVKRHSRFVLDLTNLLSENDITLINDFLISLAIILVYMYIIVYQYENITSLKSSSLTYIDRLWYIKCLYEAPFTEVHTWP